MKKVDAGDVAFSVIITITIVLIVLFWPLRVICRFIERMKETRYGIVYDTLQQAIITLELENLDRSAWGEEPSDRTIRLCPRCEAYHDGEEYCTRWCRFKAWFHV